MACRREDSGSAEQAELMGAMEPRWSETWWSAMPLARWLTYRARQLLSGIAVAALAVLSGVILRDLWHWASDAAQLPRWDMAKYGAAASRLQQALESWDLVGWLGAINDLSSWPFLLPLIESFAFSLWGNGFATARCLMVLLLGLTMVMTFDVARRLTHPSSEVRVPGDRLAGIWVPVAASALVISSPKLQLYGVLNMLEIPGALLLLCALASYLRALATPRGRWVWQAVVLTSLLLFFCKYNYGLIWLAALTLAELRRRQASWKAAAHDLWHRVTARDLGRPWAIFVLVVLTILAGLRISGGIEWQLGSLELRATSIGNPMYGLLLLEVMRRLLWRRQRRLVHHRWSGLTPSARTLIGGIGAPILLWMLIPPHCKDFFGFVENRSSSMSWTSLDPWLFYPRLLADGYLAWGGLALPLLALLVIAVLWLPRLAAPQRIVVLLVLIHGLALLAHPYKLPRFGLTLLAPWLILSCWTAHELLHRALAARRRLLGGAQGLVLLSVVLSVGFLTRDHWQRPPSQRVQWTASFKEQTVPPSSQELLDRVLELANAEIPEDASSAREPVVLLGTWNLFSPALVEWRGAQRTDKRASLLAGHAARRHIRRQGWPSRVLELEWEAASWRADLTAAYQAETADLEGQRAVLRSASFRLQSSESWESAGYTLNVYRRLPDSR